MEVRWGLLWYHCLSCGTSVVNTVLKVIENKAAVIVLAYVHSGGSSNSFGGTAEMRSRGVRVIGQASVLAACSQNDGFHRLSRVAVMAQLS